MFSVSNLLPIQSKEATGKNEPEQENGYANYLETWEYSYAQSLFVFFPSSKSIRFSSNEVPCIDAAHRVTFRSGCVPKRGALLFKQ